jgi:predicted nucleotidyltransferase
MKRLALTDEELAGFCQRHRIRRLALFGSVLKGTARPDSDIDLLVEFEPEAKPTLLDLAAMEEEGTTVERRSSATAEPSE